MLLRYLVPDFETAKFGLALTHSHTYRDKSQEMQFIFIPLLLPSRLKKVAEADQQN